MQLSCAPLWDVVSDRYGRKPILAIGTLGYTITLFLFGLVQSFLMLFLARTLSGILLSATQPTAMAYIGENTAQKEKSKRMGQFGMMVGLGVILGPLMGWYLSTCSLSFPFFVGSGLAFIALLLVIFLLPESKLSFSPTGELIPSNEPILTFQPDSDNRPRLPDIYARILISPAGILLLLIFIMSFGMTNFQGMIGLYAVDKFAFNTKQVGAIWMVMGIVFIVGQGFLVGALTKRLGDLLLIKIGLFGGAIGFVLLALGYFVLALALIGAALNSHISSFAGERQGTVMGLNSAAKSLGCVFGPLWGGTSMTLTLTIPSSAVQRLF